MKRLFLLLAVAVGAWAYAPVPAEAARGCGPGKVKLVSTGGCITRLHARKLGIRVYSRKSVVKTRSARKSRIAMSRAEAERTSRLSRSVADRGRKFTVVEPEPVAVVAPAPVRVYRAPDPAFGTLFPKPNTQVDLETWVERQRNAYRETF